MNRARPAFPVVGVGASAGGVESLEGLFRGMPDRPGVALVVVTHLSPERESFLHQIIARHTQLSVEVAADGTSVEPDRVYVLPADAVIGIEGGVLRVNKGSPAARRERKPIDAFLASLAADRGEYAASIILSGGDGDGALGTKAVKEAGGLTMAQTADGHGPSHPDMPAAAISTGCVDLAIPADQMGARLAEFANGLIALDGMAVEVEGADGGTWEKARRKIYPILRNQLGHDFAGYKPNTFARRVQRRMQVTHAASLDAYVDRLKSDPAEVSALFRDLLINVTGFFRDKTAFEALAKAVIPEIFAGRGAQDTVRVWVPGCATGEEVYSIAILAREFMDGLTAIPRVQIFATDIDEHALSVARAGRYPREALEGVTAERRRRFFHPDAAGFVIAKEIRELCVFSPHSVIRDPPFSRVDLISCRNLLIYFGLDSQNQVIPIFHYALRPRGFLFLGASENVSQFGELFAAVDKKHRIYKARDGAGSRLRLAGLMGPQRTDFRAEAVARAATTAGTSLRDQINAQVLGEFAPAHVVVGRDGDVVYYSTKTGKYLEAAPGSPSRQLLTMVRKGLRLDVRSALRECVESGARIVRPGLLSEGPDGQTQLVTLTIEPVSGRNGEEPLYLLLFADQGPPGTEAEAISRLRSSADGASERLEAELRETRERLQSLIEEYETALEELKSSNEELVSVNEELQSTNEEMEASKEEMQSLNEELQTVNAELHGKVDALDAANADLQNLFESTQVATIFLDRDLAIRSYTPAVGQLFNILPTDRGRPITDLASRIPLPGLADDIAQVLADGQRLERRMEQAQTSYLLRVAPYRDSSARNEGVVVTLVDVTSLTQAEAHLQVMIAELNHRVKNMLTVAIAITSETHKGARTVTEFRVSLIDRLHAMARSYELLSRENWIGASIDELVRQQLAPFGLERVTFGGPPVKLKPRQALSVGMVLHELATNASKYGAFSADAGKVDLAWTQVDGEIRLDWREHGGPATGEPPRRGFGLKLVEREAAHNLGGEVKIEFPSAGARASVAFPVASD